MGFFGHVNCHSICGHLFLTLDSKSILNAWQKYGSTYTRNLANEAKHTSPINNNCAHLPHYTLETQSQWLEDPPKSQRLGRDSCSSDEPHHIPRICHLKSPHHIEWASQWYILMRKQEEQVSMICLCRGRMACIRQTVIWWSGCVTHVMTLPDSVKMILQHFRGVNTRTTITTLGNEQRAPFT